MNTIITLYILSNLLLAILYLFFRDISIDTKSYFKRVGLLFIPVINILVVGVNVHGLLTGEIVPYYKIYFKKKVENWVSVKIKLPFCYQSGHWDGLKSERVLVRDKTGKIHIAVLYQGFMDGSEFADWYDKDDYELKEIEYWVDIPD